MIEESILKSNFVGRDGFRWWIGQVAVASAQGKQINGEGWGHRWKVRIMGYHPYSTAQLSDEDLPWAHVMLPTTAGTGGSNYATTPKIRPGDVVLGFFLDGDDGQLPMIMGSFGRTSSVPSASFKGAFIPFTGYSDNVKKPNGTLSPKEAGESNSTSQETPRDLPEATVSKVNEKKEKEYSSQLKSILAAEDAAVEAAEAKEQKKPEKQLPISSAVGQEIVIADSSKNTNGTKIGTEVSNLIRKVNSPFGNVPSKIAEISRSVDKIIGITEGIVGGSVDILFEVLVPILQKGLRLLYDAVFKAVFAATQNYPIAHFAGVAAQHAMVYPVQLLQDFIVDLPGIVLNKLTGTVKSMLTDIVDNAKRPDPCIETQATASIVREVLRQIQSSISGVLGGVSRILSLAAPAFSVFNTLSEGITALTGLSGLFDTNQNKNNSYDNVNNWAIGIGPAAIVDGILKSKNVLDSIQRSISTVKNIKEDAEDGFSQVKQGFDIFSSATSDSAIRGKKGRCYTGEIEGCSSIPKIKIFGGMGEGGEADVLLGDFVNEGEEISASVIGAILKDRGKNYKYPPFVIVEDECGKGYGTVLRSTIDDDGKIDNIYVVSPGENYPIGNSNVNIPSEVSDSLSPNIPAYVSDVSVIKPGIGYTLDDKIIDTVGNTYHPILNSDGGIESVDLVLGEGANPDTPGISVTSLNNYIPVDDLVIINIESDTGFGAILKPILSRIPEELIDPNKKQTLRNTTFVKDCIE